jgi:hypothetical protein
VENAEDANLRAQMLGIGSDGEQSGDAHSEQQMVKQTGVLQSQQGEFVRDGEDDVKVVGGQKFPLPGCQPAFTSLSLALRATPVAARVVENGLVSAFRTGIEVAPERGGAAVLNRSEGFELLEI